MVFSQGAPLRNREPLRFPALSFWPGHMRRQLSHSGDRRELTDVIGKSSLIGPRLRVHARHPSVDFKIDDPDRGPQSVPLAEMELEKKTMMVGQSSVQRVIQFLRCGFHPAADQSRQFAGVAHPGDHRLDHASPAEAHDVAEHRIEANVRLGNWAVTQFYLGGALKSLGDITGDRAALDRAEAAYRDAMLEYTCERAPTAWANLNNNIG